MFRFAHKEYLFLLTLLLPMVLVFIYHQRWRLKALERFGEKSLVARLVPDLSNPKHVLKFSLLALAFVFLVLGFANPQVGSKMEKVKRSGIDVVIALDVSRSMLAEDVKPNRLLRAKNFISNFIDELHNDRLGMIVFAGKAYLQMPLTVDYSAARLYLKMISTDMVPTQGTAIGEAVNMARESFVKGDNKHKALILISDGEDNEEGAEAAIEEAAKEGVKVFTIGVGTDKGSPIPVMNNGVQVDYKRDGENNIVLTKLNQEMLRSLASKGNGKYFQLGSGNDEIGAIFKELGRINTKDFEETVFTDYDNWFPYCLAIAFVLLALEFVISERKSGLNFKI